MTLAPSRPPCRLQPLSKPDIGPQPEEAAVLSVLRSGRLSIGPMVEKFEAQVAQREQFEELPLRRRRQQRHLAACT
jgi:hypothetical protein